VGDSLNFETLVVRGQKVRRHAFHAAMVTVLLILFAACLLVPEWIAGRTRNLIEVPGIISLSLPSSEEAATAFSRPGYGLHIGFSQPNSTLETRLVSLAGVKDAHESFYSQRIPKVPDPLSLCFPLVCFLTATGALFLNERVGAIWGVRRRWRWPLTIVAVCGSMSLQGLYLVNIPRGAEEFPRTITVISPGVPMGTLAEGLARVPLCRGSAVSFQAQCLLAHGQLVIDPSLLNQADACDARYVLAQHAWFAGDVDRVAGILSAWTSGGREPDDAMRSRLWAMVDYVRRQKPVSAARLGEVEAFIGPDIPDRIRVGLFPITFTAAILALLLTASIFRANCVLAARVSRLSAVLGNRRDVYA
jgi:hypothetical protein